MALTLLAAIALIATLAFAIHRRAAAKPEQINASAIGAPKGWLSGNIQLDDALEIARRHLPTAGSGSNMRLQYGPKGCLTLWRMVDRNKQSRYVLRWEFWRPDPELAERMIDLPALEIKRPKRETLELVFEGDYVAFEHAVRTAFQPQDIVIGAMHLTWNC